MPADYAGNMSTCDFPEGLLPIALGGGKKTDGKERPILAFLRKRWRPLKSSGLTLDILRNFLRFSGGINPGLLRRTESLAEQGETKENKQGYILDRPAESRTLPGGSLIRVPA